LCSTAYGSVAKRIAFAVFLLLTYSFLVSFVSLMVQNAGLPPDAAVTFLRMLKFFVSDEPVSVIAATATVAIALQVAVHDLRSDEARVASPSEVARAGVFSKVASLVSGATLLYGCGTLIDSIFFQLLVRLSQLRRVHIHRHNVGDSGPLHRRSSSCDHEGI
jgi:hypothetical protein